jgi:hypothetical protein
MRSGAILDIQIFSWFRSHFSPRVNFNCYTLSCEVKANAIPEPIKIERNTLPVNLRAKILLVKCFVFIAKTA